jgi:hypothetical protein
VAVDQGLMRRVAVLGCVCYFPPHTRSSCLHRNAGTLGTLLKLTSHFRIHSLSAETLTLRHAFCFSKILLAASHTDNTPHDSLGR